MTRLDLFDSGTGRVTGHTATITRAGSALTISTSTGLTGAFVAVELHPAYWYLACVSAAGFTVCVHQADLPPDLARRLHLARQGRTLDPDDYQDHPVAAVALAEELIAETPALPLADALALAEAVLDDLDGYALAWERARVEQATALADYARSWDAQATAQGNPHAWR